MKFSIHNRQKMAPTEGEPTRLTNEEGTQAEESTINDMFECTFCETSFLGPPQSNQQLQLYKDHLTGFHKMSKEVNKMIHQVASEYKTKIESKKVLASKDNQIPDEKEKQTQLKINNISTQTCPKDFYHNFMHQDWDSSIDWKIIPNPKPLTAPKKVPIETKENNPENDKSMNHSLPIVIEQALSLKKEAFDKLGTTIQFPLSDIGSTKITSSPKNNLNNVIKKEESPNKKRELNINDWTRPVKSNVVIVGNTSQPSSNKSVKLKWEEKDKNINGKYTFDLIKESSAKRQKIVVRFKQEESHNVNVIQTQSEPLVAGCSVESNGIISTDQSVDKTSKLISSDNRLLDSQIVSSLQSTSKLYGNYL